MKYLIAYSVLPDAVQSHLQAQLQTQAPDYTRCMRLRRKIPLDYHPSLGMSPWEWCRTQLCGETAPEGALRMDLVRIDMEYTGNTLRAASQVPGITDDYLEALWTATEAVCAAHGYTLIRSTPLSWRLMPAHGAAGTDSEGSAASVAGVGNAAGARDTAGSASVAGAGNAAGAESGLAARDAAPEAGVKVVGDAVPEAAGALRAPALSTEAILLGHHEDWWPKEACYSRLRALLNEIHMAWHLMPTHQALRDEGQTPPLNGVWIYPETIAPLPDAACSLPAGDVPAQNNLPAGNAPTPNNLPTGDVPTLIDDLASAFIAQDWGQWAKTLIQLEKRGLFADQHDMMLCDHEHVWHCPTPTAWQRLCHTLFNPFKRNAS